MEIAEKADSRGEPGPDGLLRIIAAARGASSWGRESPQRSAPPSREPGGPAGAGQCAEESGGPTRSRAAAAGPGSTRGLGRLGLGLSDGLARESGGGLGP